MAKSTDLRPCVVATSFTVQWRRSGTCVCVRPEGLDGDTYSLMKSKLAALPTNIISFLR